MNKRGLTKYIFILIASIISFYFLITTKVTGIGFVPTVLSFIFALTIFMFLNKDKVKRGRFVYDVILLLFLIFTIGMFVYLAYCEIKCYFETSCGVDLVPLFIMIYSMFFFVMLLVSYKDIFDKTNKVNDILTIVVSLLIVLIHIRYYFDPSFPHNITADEQYIQYSYVTQNYIYFIIMYMVVILHRRVNKS